MNVTPAMDGVPDRAEFGHRAEYPHREAAPTGPSHPTDPRLVLATSAEARAEGHHEADHQAGTAFDGRPAGPYSVTYAGQPLVLAAGEGYPGVEYAGPVYLAPTPSKFSQLVLRMHARAPRWALPVAVAACFAGAASYVWISNPTDSGAADIPTCIIKLTTGLDCPGCGGTRAFYYLLHGNVPEAARHHAMAVFAAPFLVWLYVAWTVKHIWGKQLPVPTISAKTLSFYLAAWAVFMVVRNLPFAPFTSLYV